MYTPEKHSDTTITVEQVQLLKGFCPGSSMTSTLWFAVTAYRSVNALQDFAWLVYKAVSHTGHGRRHDHPVCHPTRICQACTCWMWVGDCTLVYNPDLKLSPIQFIFQEGFKILAYTAICKQAIKLIARFLCKTLAKFPFCFCSTHNSGFPAFCLQAQTPGNESKPLKCSHPHISGRCFFTKSQKSQ